MNSSSQKRKEVIAAIVDVTLRSARSEKIEIFEIGNLDDFLPHKKAEELRREFTDRKTPIRQITNSRKFVSWTSESGMIQNLQVKYVPKENFDITNEILIFGNTVAFYRLNPNPFYHEISDKPMAKIMSNFFSNIWQMGDSLKLTGDGSTLTKQYLPISAHFGNIPMVIYPARDDGDITKAFSRKKIGSLEDYVESILNEHSSHYQDADMILAYVWNQETVPYCDVWKITRNRLSDDSGFLYDVRVYKNTSQITDMGVASGNSSIVLTAEEMLLRELILTKGLSFSEASKRDIYRARFPAGYLPDEAFYQA